jgi:hypothetical protein
MKCRDSAFISTCMLLAAASSASADWTVIRLVPDQAVHNYCLNGRAGELVGMVESHAVHWNQDGMVLTELHPAGMVESRATSSHNGFAVGEVAYNAGGNRHAALWNVATGTWVKLTPAGSTRSIANGIHGNTQVGSAVIGGSSRAAMWHGTPASFIDMTPSTATSGQILSLDATHQGGQANVGGQQHAGYWAGTAASWVDLHPLSPYVSSRCFAVWNGQQGGVAVHGLTYLDSAMLWSGTAASAVNLHPPADVVPAKNSYVLAITDGVQVGQIEYNDRFYAVMWRGTAESCVRIDQYLPYPMMYGRANAVWREGTKLYIAGGAYNSTTFVNEPVLWIHNECDADFDSSGFLDVEDYSAFVSAFESGLESADFDGSGFVDIEDFSAFVAAFEVGC